MNLIINASWLGLILIIPGLFAVYERPERALVEICDNAIDDDGDGEIDLNDADCDCPVIEPVSLIPNPSFEETSCCPSSRSQLYCADNWIQASEATTDLLHSCGWMGWEEFPPPMPFPDGEAVVGLRDGRAIQGDSQPGWKEYAGACLLSPLLKNTEYRFEFDLGFVNRQQSPPIEITFFGSSSCDNLPFGIGDDFFGCPTNGPGWIRLASTTVSADRGWVKTRLNVIPREDIYTIAIGPPCQDNSSSISLYYFFDNLVLADERSFQFRISEIEHPCSSDFRLGIPFEEGIDYQWYMNGVALVGETSPELSKIYGEGDYQVRIVGERICNLTNPYRYRIPVFHTDLNISICDDEYFEFDYKKLRSPGNFADTIKNSNNCDSIVSLNLQIVGFREEDVKAKIFEGEKFNIGHRSIRRKGDYLINLISSLGCDSLVNLELDYYQIYFPNVFSPNGDGINDVFEINGPDLEEIVELAILDRWGSVLHSASGLNLEDQPVWNGKHQNQVLPADVYNYLVKIRMDDGLIRTFSGSVLLIR